MSILNLVRPDLLNSPNYIPGGDQAKYRLQANELPWSPITMDELNLNYYPDMDLQKQLQEQLAIRYEVDSNQIALTRGSDDGIELLIKLFLTAREDAFMQFPPTFPMYAFYVRLQQAEMIDCGLDLTNSFSLTFDKIQSHWQPNCKIIMFCSPNNPTANLIDLSLIAKVCEQYANRSVIVVDEAYIEFAKAPSAITLIPKFENLIVLRTLSKAYGLAGLRIGSIIAQPHIILAINKIIAPYTIASPSLKLARKALSNNSWFTESIEYIRSSRDWIIKELSDTSTIEKIYPTETNFLLVKTRFARQLTSWLAKHGIAIRDFPASSLLHDHLRLTIGNEEQNQILIQAITSFDNE
nr:histidinol-phosphate transaminase [Legionella norrlandica]